MSCPDAGSCVAVGVLNRHSGTDVPLVERWDGNTWSARTAPVPAGATTARLTGVSCPTTTACTAAGTFVDPHGDDRTLAETVHGTTWQVVATPNEPGAVATIFNAVSCRSAGFCDAVGYSYGLSSSGHPLPPVAFAAAETAGHWTRQAVPTPSGTGSSLLSAVSCGTEACTATGYLFASSGRQVSFAVTR